MAGTENVYWRINPTTNTPTMMRNIRIVLGLPKRSMAAIIGVSAETLSNWEEGRRDVPGPVARLYETIADNPQEWLSRVLRPERRRNRSRVVSASRVYAGV